MLASIASSGGDICGRRAAPGANSAALSFACAEAFPARSSDTAPAAR
jgi:hypothetical protein